MTHAVIAGGSLAGLVTAKALSTSFATIEIIEPDAEPIAIEARKGVPQGRHVHGLLKGGADALTTLFPDLNQRLSEKGAATADFCKDVKWYINKRYMPRFTGDIPIHFQSRPLLEQCLREAIGELKNITITYQAKVTDYQVEQSSNRIVSADIKVKNQALRRQTADLFVDATGRGSLLSNWLSKNGFGEVPVSRTTVDLGYASCFLKLQADPTRDWSSLLVYPTGPDEIRGCTLVGVENDNWLLTLAGYHNDHPPADKEGFLEFAKNLPRPEVYDAIEGAEFQSEISLHKFPSSQHRHYRRLSKLPNGIIPVGDTNISLNPLFGQGMSVAILSAAHLGELIALTDLRDEKSMTKLSRNYLMGLDTIFKTPWDLAMGQDFKYPQTIGEKPMGLRIKNILKSLILSSSSTEIIAKFFKVVHLVEKETVFYHPLRALKVLVTARLKG